MTRVFEPFYSSITYACLNPPPHIYNSSHFKTYLDVILLLQEIILLIVGQ